MEVIETTTNNGGPDILVEIETAEVRENLSIVVHGKATNDDDPDTPVEPDISDTGSAEEAKLAEILDRGAREEIEFQDNSTSVEEETDVRNEAFRTHAIGTAIEATSIPDASCGPIIKEIMKDHCPTQEATDERKDRFETETIDTAIDVREFPDAFYDPNTNELMIDPVVIPNGNSYERSAIMEQQGDDIESGYKLYPNRALIAVINETVKLSGDSIEAGMRRLSKSIQTSMRQLISNEDFRPLPDVYYCPITFGVIHFPVIDAEGYTFEKVAIEAWIQKNGKSPITRTPLSKEDLYSNHAIAALLEEEKGKSVENMHPSIRNFIDADPPEAPRNLPLSAVEIHNFPITPEDLEVLEVGRLRREKKFKQKLLTFIIVFQLIPTTVLLSFLPEMWMLLVPLLALSFCIALIMCTCFKLSDNPYDSY